MGTRQYVGARYVPTFANPIQWDSNRAYEPLTMVTYLNNTYTSKKPVPQGVDITNTEYWALTGNYNAQVEQYRQEIERLKKYKYSVNVKEMGAVGNGSTNDTDAVASAITLAGDSPIYFPVGTYIVSDSVNIPNFLADIGTQIFNENGKNHHSAKPIQNTFNKVIGNNNNFYSDAKLSPREALIANSFCWGDVASGTLEKEGTLSNNTNKIKTDTEGIEIGDAVLFADSSFPDGSTIYNSVRVISLDGDGVTVGIDNGEGAGVGSSTWVWSGKTLSGTFTFRHRMWRCNVFAGITTGTTKNPDSLSWVENLVGVSNGQPLTTSEIDTIVNGDNNNQDINSLLITGQNHSGALVNSVNVQMGGPYNGQVGFSARNHVIGYFANTGTAFLFDSKWYNNVTKTPEPIFGGIVQSDYGNYESTRPSIAVRQVTNGAVCLDIKPYTDSASGLLIRGTNTTGSAINFGVDTEGRVITPIIRIAKLPSEKQVVCTHVFEFEASDGSVWEIPCVRKS